MPPPIESTPLSHNSAPKKVQFAMRTTVRGLSHYAIARLDESNRPRTGSGRDRERAIADALHRARVFYADLDVERSVLRAEARHEKIDLVLVDDTLHLPNCRDRGAA